MAEIQGVFHYFYCNAQHDIMLIMKNKKTRAGVFGA